MGGQYRVTGQTYEIDRGSRRRHRRTGWTDRMEGRDGRTVWTDRIDRQDGGVRRDGWIDTMDRQVFVGIIGFILMETFSTDEHF